VVIAGHLLEPVETVTAQDGQGSTSKFSKTLIVVEASDRSYEKILVIGSKSSLPSWRMAGSGREKNDGGREGL
jgi:hypothetical protein